MDAKEVLKIGKNVNFLAIQNPEPLRIMLEELAIESFFEGRETYCIVHEIADGEVISLYQVKGKSEEVFFDKVSDFQGLEELYIKLIDIVKANNSKEISIFAYQPEGVSLLADTGADAFLISLRQDEEIELSKIILGIVSTNPQLPKGWERFFYKINYSLPNEEWRRNAIVLGVYRRLENLGIPKEIDEVEKMLGEETIETFVKLSKGMTGEEIINALKLALEDYTPENPKLNFAKFIKIKENIIKQNPVLEIYHPQDVDPLVGFELAWKITEKAFEKNMQRGILLLGIPGMGKSLFAKNLSRRYDLPTIFFDLSRVFGSYVGESERKMDEALQTIEEIGEAIVVIDEIDKVMAGMGAGGRGDNGVSERVFGKFHTWLQDRRNKSFIIATANDISHLPASLFRAGRWNAILYVDFYPSVEHYQKLIEIYTQKYGVDKAYVDIEASELKERKFTGAEVADLVEKAYLFDIPLSTALQSNLVIPIAEAEPEKLAIYEQYRGKYLSAHESNKSTSPSPEKGRKAKRFPFRRFG